jgi:hypothetical protein
MLAKTLIALLTVSTLLTIPSTAKAGIEIQNGNTRMNVGGGRVDIEKKSDVVTVPRYPIYRDQTTQSIRVLPDGRTVRVVRPKIWRSCKQNGSYHERYQTRSSGSSNVQVYSSSSTTVCR